MTRPNDPPPLFPHQQELLDRTWELPAWAIFFQTGCVDCATEYLSPDGWRHIDQYQSGEVAQWWPHTAKAEFVLPQRYVVLPCEESMLRISGKYGTDQLLSLDHRVPLLERRKGMGPSARRYWKTIEARELPRAKMRCLPSRAEMKLRGSGIALSDADLRLQVAVMADGHFGSQTARCVVRVKKPRKIVRLTELLRLAGREAYIRPGQSQGFVIFSFEAPLRQKTYPLEWWPLISEAQAELLAEEVFQWDGTVSGDRKIYRSRYQVDVDFIQYVLMSRGLVTRRSCFPERVGDRVRGQMWEVSVRGKHVGGFWSQASNYSYEQPADGKMYCFTVPSGYLLLRRNGIPFPTGNCGKTAPTIHTAARLFDAHRIEGSIVVAPNMVHRNWITDEIPLHSPIAWRGLDWHSSRAKAQDRALVNLLETPPGVLPWFALTYEALITPRGRQAVLDFKVRFPRFMLVIDESSRVKNPEATRTKKVAALRKLAAYVRILNGTPVAQAATDVYAQLKILDDMYWIRHGFGSWTAFQARFCVFKKIQVGGEDDREANEVKRRKWEPTVPHDADPEGVAAYEQLDLTGIVDESPPMAGVTTGSNSAAAAPATIGRTIEVPVGYRDLDKLHALIQPISTRLTKEQAGLDLPPKLYQRLVFELVPEQRRVYDQLRREYMVELEGGLLVTAALAMVRILRLQQVACGYLPNPHDPEADPILIPGAENPRFRAFMEWMEDIGKQQAIVWCRFTHDVDVICRELGPAMCVRFDGKVSEKEKAKALELFKSGARRVCVAKASSMGMGLTLAFSHLSFYYSNSFSLLERLQSEDRQHRVGQHNAVTYVDLIADKTVDEKILKVLKSRNDVANAVTGDAFREWLA